MCEVWEVGGFVEGWGVFVCRVGLCVWCEFWWAEHVGGVSFEEKSVIGDLFDELPGVLFFWLCEVGGDGEVGAEVEVVVEEFFGAAVAMHEEASWGRAFCIEDVEEFAEGFEAVYGCWELALSCEVELCTEGFLLRPIVTGV